MFTQFYNRIHPVIIGLQCCIVTRRGSKGIALPGWKLDGKKDKKAWEGDNPKKETYKLWVQFIKDNYENGGWPAGLDGAPDFDDYKDRARKGAGP